MLAMYTVPNESKKLSSNQTLDIEQKHADFRLRYETSGILLNGAGLDLQDKSKLIGQDMPNISKSILDSNAPQVTAYYIVECKDEQQATAISEELLDDHVVAVEVRHIHPSNGM